MLLSFQVNPSLLFYGQQVQVTLEKNEHLHNLKVNIVMEKYILKEKSMPQFL